jgi:integrase
VGSELRPERYTVEAACRDYVADRRSEKNAACAHDAQKRFERTVYGTAFGKLPLVRLLSVDIKSWRRDTGLSKSSQNRTMTALRAALNLAVQNRRIAAERRIEWASVRQHSGVTQRRLLFLDLEERRRLIRHAQGAVCDLMAAMALTGARPGDLTGARRSQYDARTQSVTFAAKQALRTVPLSSGAAALFDRLAQGKLPSELLFTRDDGKGWAHSDWDELVRAAAQSAGLPAGVCLYTLRHSFITQALMDGMSTLEVARISGTSLAMIERHYGHLVMHAARERLERVTLL